MSSRRIMVVEDDLDIREAIIEILVEHGYDAVGAANGREALELLAPGRHPALPHPARPH